MNFFINFCCFFLYIFVKLEQKKRSIGLRDFSKKPSLSESNRCFLFAETCETFSRYDSDLPKITRDDHTPTPTI